MRTNFLPAALACVVALSACTSQLAPPPSTGTPQASASLPSATAWSSATAVAPPGLELDEAAAASLVIGADGGRVAVASGGWKALIAVPKGSATAGTTWTVTPLRRAPDGVPDAQAPGVYVDEAGQPPTGDCLIGFSTEATADPDATIVKLSADGIAAELVATDRQQVGSSTLLVAEVSGFSGYTVGKGSAAARAAAREKRKQKVGKSHWVISVHDKVSFSVEDWKFGAKLDLNLAGGGTTNAGSSTGKAELLFTGKYDKNLGGVIKGLGDIKWTGRGNATAHLFGDLGSLAPLWPLDDEKMPYQMEEPVGYGSFIIKGSGSLDMLAKAPAGTYKAPGIPVKGGVKVPYRISIQGTKVTLEIANLGEFSGDLVKF